MDDSMSHSPSPSPPPSLPANLPLWVEGEGEALREMAGDLRYGEPYGLVLRSELFLSFLWGTHSLGGTNRYITHIKNTECRYVWESPKESQLNTIYASTYICIVDQMEGYYYTAGYTPNHTTVTFGTVHDSWHHTCKVYLFELHANYMHTVIYIYNISKAS